jgi:protein-S-isoprenylcysteine O-methyltransferase Ste14
MSAWFRSSAALTARSVLWVLLMPGLVAVYVPWRFFGVAHAVGGSIGTQQIIGLAFVTVGIALLIACVWEFAHRGRGTLSPLDPPRELVVHGLYRYVRNPMYLGVTGILLGEAIAVRSVDLVIYWAVFISLAALFVIGYEEPHLRRQFGASYDAYTARVGRWFPRRPD